jgi:hypothetical protein
MKQDIEEIARKLKEAEDNLPKELRDIFPKGYVYKVMMEAMEKKKKEWENEDKMES